MLVEPEMDEATAALDRALAQALIARMAAGGRSGPDAEALALRDLLAATTDHRSAQMLHAVWGRMVAATGPVVFACGATALVLAADRHGLPIRPAADPDAALAEAERGARVVIDLDGPRPWWGKLLARPELRVIAALPDDRHGLPSTLMVAATPTGPTGEDRTFWVTDSGLSDTRIVEALGVCGFVGKPLASLSGLKLFMLAGYVQAEDGRLDDAPGSLSGVIGSAPLF